MLKWIITKDLIDTNQVGRGNVDSPEGLTEKFRLKDDDGNIYYEGVTSGFADAYEDEAFEPEDWAMAYAGATTTEYYEKGEWKVL
jgi:hypothetical protein